MHGQAAGQMAAHEAEQFVARMLADLPQPAVVDLGQQFVHRSVRCAPGNLVAVQLVPVGFGIRRYPGRQVDAIGDMPDRYRRQRPARIQLAEDVAAGGRAAG